SYARLPLHDALPIWCRCGGGPGTGRACHTQAALRHAPGRERFLNGVAMRGLLRPVGIQDDGGRLIAQRLCSEPSTVVVLGRRAAWGEPVRERRGGTHPLFFVCPVKSRFRTAPGRPIRRTPCRPACRCGARRADCGGAPESSVNR